MKRSPLYKFNIVKSSTWTNKLFKWAKTRAATIKYRNQWLLCSLETQGVLLCSGPISIRNCMPPQLPEVITNIRAIPADNTLQINRAQLHKEGPSKLCAGLRMWRAQFFRVSECPTPSKSEKNVLQADYLCPFRTSLEETTEWKGKIFEKFQSTRALHCRTPRTVNPL